MVFIKMNFVVKIGLLEITNLPVLSSNCIIKTENIGSLLAMSDDIENLDKKYLFTK